MYIGDFSVIFGGVSGIENIPHFLYYNHEKEWASSCLVLFYSYFMTNGWSWFSQTFWGMGVSAGLPA